MKACRWGGTMVRAISKGRHRMRGGGLCLGELMNGKEIASSEILEVG